MRYIRATWARIWRQHSVSNMLPTFLTLEKNFFLKTHQCFPDCLVVQVFREARTGRGPFSSTVEGDWGERMGSSWTRSRSSASSSGLTSALRASTPCTRTTRTVGPAAEAVTGQGKRQPSSTSWLLPTEATPTSLSPLWALKAERCPQKSSRYVWVEKFDLKTFPIARSSTFQADSGVFYSSVLIKFEWLIRSNNE